MFVHRRHYGYWFAAGCGLLTIAPANAQLANAETPPQHLALEEVVVTATKRGAEALRDVPISIQAISGATLAKSGVAQFSDYANRVSSLSYQDLGPGDKKYIIRGINSTGAATVGTYYDEAVISANNSNDGGGRNADVRLYDIERIEVLKGPQGTLYGASSQSGTIRIVTNKPDAHSYSGYINTDLATTHEGGNNYAVNGALNVPVVEDKLAARAVGWYVDDSGFIDQPRIATGRLDDVNTDETRGGRFGLRYTPTVDFSLTAAATYQKTQSDGSSRYTPPGTRSFSTAGYPPMDGGDLINTDLTRSPLIDEIHIYSLTAEYELQHGAIVATTNFFDRELHYYYDSSPVLFSFGLPIAGVVYQPQTRQIWSNEIRYASKLDGPVNFVTGTFYSEERSDFEVRVLRSDAGGRPIGTFSPLDSDDALLTPIGNTFFGRYDNREIDQYAIFGELSLEVTPTLKVTGGARYFHSNLGAVQQTTHNFGGSGGAVFLPETNQDSDQRTTYKANISWKPIEDVLVYATAAQGFRTGGLNQANLLFISDIPRSYRSDVLWNYEIGTKLSLFQGQLRLDAAAYRIDWSDVQVAATDPTGTFPYVTNAGSAAVNGFEASIIGRLADGIVLELTGAYQDAQLTADQPGPVPRPASLGLDGDPIPNIPRFSGSINLDVDRPLKEQLSYLLHADLSWRDSSHTKLRRNVDPFDVRLASYALVNLRAGLVYDEWTVAIFARNLFDKRAEVDAIASLQDPLALLTVRPRTIGVSLTKTF